MQTIILDALGTTVEDVMPHFTIKFCNIYIYTHNVVYHRVAHIIESPTFPYILPY